MRSGWICVYKFWNGTNNFLTPWLWHTKQKRVQGDPSSFWMSWEFIFSVMKTLQVLGTHFCKLSLRKESRNNVLQWFLNLRVDCDRDNSCSLLKTLMIFLIRQVNVYCGSLPPDSPLVLWQPLCINWQGELWLATLVRKKYIECIRLCNKGGYFIV